MGQRELKKFQLLHQWMQLKINRIGLKEFFEDRKINSIAVYGMGELGWLMYEELKADGAKAMVRYGIDQRGSMADGEIPVYTLLPTLESTDAIVITPVLITESIEDEIYKVLGEQRVLTVEEILYELGRKHGIPLSCGEGESPKPGETEKKDRYKMGLASAGKCTGCAVCAAICPVQAVSMKPNKKKGFLYPYIDEKICIQCGQCGDICPANHLYGKNTAYSQVYAANNKDMATRYQSASGGLFSAFAVAMLRSGGSVAGVSYAEGNTCKHKIAENEAELECLKGTKYFQSDMKGIYRQVEKQVKKKGKNVLFCGTPCQVRAIKNFAEKKGIKEHLVLLDLLCRGVPSPYVYQKYIEFIEDKYKKKIINVHFKEKTRGWNNLGTIFTFEDGTIEYEDGKDSLLEDSFMRTNLSIRDACFQCPYKTIRRESDITIADFWGLRNNHLLDNKGTSLVVVNTEKGEKLFEKAKINIDYMPSTMWRVYKGNEAAFHAVFCNQPKRELFFNLLHMGRNLKEAISEAMDYRN